jgi:5-methylcytosine-specific restriction endonuclease McrA
VTLDKDFLAPRRCMREPIDEIFHAAKLLDRATDAHLEGDHSAADTLIRAANIPAVRAWTESLWGSKASNPNQQMYHRIRKVPGAPPRLANAQRIRKRMPSSDEEKSIIEHYGRNCVFCGIPLISKKVRVAFKRAYADALPWGRTNKTQHAAFQCMWMQFDHLLPHSRGGDNTLENVVVTCAPCNNARWHLTLDEVGLIDPRTLPIQKTSWDGLERFLTALN